jgi:hypothetical protein
LDSAELLVARAAALLFFSALPVKEAAHAQQNANALIATIRFAGDAGRSILIPVRVNGGREGWWVLDTGATECIVDRGTAANARLATRGTRQLRGAGKGTVRLDSIRSRVRLEIAGRSLPTCDHFGAVDLTSSATGYRPIAGILGYEFFARYVVRIDFSAYTIQLYDPVRYRYQGTGDTLRIEFDRRQPRVAVSIRTAHRPEVTRHLIIDTGSEDAVDDSAVRRTLNGPAVTVQTTGLGSSYDVAIGTLDTVRIGRSVFADVPGVASDVGIVGNGIWSRFVCIFDYPHRRLFLESL